MTAPTSTLTRPLTRSIDVGTDATSSPSSSSSPLPRWPAVATAFVLVAAVGLSGLRGADYPAHYLRAELVRRTGTTIWNFAWYTGHPTLAYGVLSPLLGALVGPFAVVGFATLLATHLFAAMVTELLEPRPAAIAGHAFAVTAAVNVLVGRVAFGLGLALGLVALTCWRQNRRAWAIAAAVATPLASPVAAVLLVVSAGAVVAGSGRRRWRTGVALVAAAGTPVALMSVLFEGAGWFPFRAGHLLASVGVLAGLVACIRLPAIRIGAIAVIVISIALFVVPNPLGGNVVRLAQIVAVPLILAVTFAARNSTRAGRATVRLMTAVALMWSLSPGAVEVAAAIGDPSSSIEYHQPLIDVVRRLNADGRPPGRVEVPFTVNHWESFYVAAEVPYVRGWERQRDLARNPELYRSDLTPEQYRAWLDRNAVRWVAVADVAVDHGGAAEIRVVDEVLRSRRPWLREAWVGAHWRVYEVVDALPIVDYPAVVKRLEPGEVWLHTARPAIVTLRATGSRWLTIWPAGCLAPTPDGMLQVTLPHAGDFRIAASLLGPVAGESQPPC